MHSVAPQQYHPPSAAHCCLPVLLHVADSCAMGQAQEKRPLLLEQLRPWLQRGASVPQSYVPPSAEHDINKNMAGACVSRLSLLHANAPMIRAFAGCVASVALCCRLQYGVCFFVQKSTLMVRQ